MNERIYDPWGQCLTEYGRFRLYLFFARNAVGTTGYQQLSFEDMAKALGIPPSDWTRHAIEMAAWSLHGDRHGEFSLIKVKSRHPIDKGLQVLLRVTPERLRERGFIPFAELYEQDKGAHYGR